MRLSRHKIFQWTYIKSIAGINKISRQMSIGADDHNAGGEKNSTPTWHIVPFQGGLFAFDPSQIENFKPGKPVACCFMVCDDKILLLKRSKLSFAGDTWCMPGGKMESNETPLLAVLRETKEETGIQIDPAKTNLIKTIYVRMLESKQDYPLHLFKTSLSRSQSLDRKVILNDEHTDYVWIDPIEAQQKLNLIASGKEILACINELIRKQQA